MFECNCGKKFKSEKGLKIHEKSCEFESQDSVDESPEEKTEEQTKEKKVRKTKEQMTKEHLDSQEKIMFHIPLSSGESDDSFDIVRINGYGIQIKKGVSLSLPRQVAEMLAEKYNVQMQAGKEKLVNRSDDVTDALQ